MKPARMIKSVLAVFPVIMTCVSLAAASYICLFWQTDTSSGAELIWQLALCSFICSFSSLFGMKKEGRSPSKGQMRLRSVLCFLFVNAVVMACGFLFEWFHADEWRMLLGMELTIVAVFAATCVVFYLRAKRDAERVNERLQRRNL